MKKSSCLAKLFLIVALLLCPAASASGDGPRALDDLSSSKIGNFPKRWRTWPLQRGKAEEVYHVAEESGSRYIKASDDHDVSQQIFLNFDWPVDEKPILSWRWRATALPAGADESDGSTNDSACGVYVVVGKYDGHAIKYVWSTTLPVGNTVSRHDGKLKIKVLDSGSKGAGKWAKRTVDIPSDYQALFGRKLEKNPSGIAILTDGNAMHKPAGCDYADFTISGRMP